MTFNPDVAAQMAYRKETPDFCFVKVPCKSSSKEKTCFKRHAYRSTLEGLELKQREKMQMTSAESKKLLCPKKFVEFMNHCLYGGGGDNCPKFPQNKA